MKIYNFDIVESTQDIALTKDHECVVVAKSQTKGRGRLDRTWQSSEGNLFASIVIKAEITEIFKLVMAASIGIVDAIGAGQIKWPNDILINNKKVCGILTQAGLDGFYVVGIGVNVVSAPNIEGRIFAASSLKNENIDINLTKLLESIIINIKNNMANDNLFAKYQKHLYGITKRCKINDIEGVLIGVGEDGGVLVKTDDCNINKIYAGDLLYV